MANLINEVELAYGRKYDPPGDGMGLGHPLELSSNALQALLVNVGLQADGVNIYATKSCISCWNSVLFGVDCEGEVCACLNCGELRGPVVK